ncbi:nucleosome assembly protein 1-like 3 [Perognathus longimembris pacificus]|uniref:nucleosome assembly protein 1-like 3 n=1 Tax=Perognathus longimembris pacificus TaxID=214514 RepID=UPI0020183FB7|nr:nucleosome assembly protein 1-like 3 [Perognathus longimembris pacificus]
MAEDDLKRAPEPAGQGVAEEEMASSTTDSGEESDSSSINSTTSCSSSISSSSGSSSSGSRLYRKRRVPEPSRRARQAPSGINFVNRLPQAVRNRVQALRNIQDECDKVDSLFLKAIHDLERKYAELNKPLYDKRFQIINAEYEPTEEECEWNSEDEKFSSDEEVYDDAPSEMPPLEGEEEEETPKDSTEVKNEKQAPNEISDSEPEEKNIPKEIAEVKADEQKLLEEIAEVKLEENELSKEILGLLVEEKEVPKEIIEVNTEENVHSSDCMETTPEKEEDPEDAPQSKEENKEQPKVIESKARDTVRGAYKSIPDTRPKERLNLKRVREGKPKKEDPKGIPNYWLTVLKNVDKLGPMIQKYDEPILKFLADVSLKFSRPGQPISYTFEFHFLPNPYFRNELLIKTYIIKSKPDHNDPFFSWGWEIEDCKGCKIDWRKGKDVTITTTHSRTTATGEIEFLPRVVPNASFFNFFSPPEIPQIGKLEPREDAILDKDFEIGQILHDNVILKSIYYFTGDVKCSYYRDGRDYGNRKYWK